MADTSGFDVFKRRMVENVRNALGDLVVEKDIAAAIDEEWTAFTVGLPEIRNQQGGIDRHARPSELRQMIRAEMKKRIEERLKQWGDGWQHSPECDAQVEKLIATHAHVIAQTFLQSLGTSIIKTTLELMPTVLSTSVKVCESCNELAATGRACKCGAWVN